MARALGAHQGRRVIRPWVRQHNDQVWGAAYRDAPEVAGTITSFRRRALQEKSRPDPDAASELIVAMQDAGYDVSDPFKSVEYWWEKSSDRAGGSLVEFTAWVCPFEQSPSC